MSVSKPHFVTLLLALPQSIPITLHCDTLQWHLIVCKLLILTDEQCFNSCWVKDWWTQWKTQSINYKKKVSCSVMLWFDLRRAEILFWFPFHKHQVGLLQCYIHQGRPNYLIWFDTWGEMISFIRKKQNCPHQVIGCLIHQGRPIPFDSMSAGVPDICCTSRH